MEQDKTNDQKTDQEQDRDSARNLDLELNEGFGLEDDFDEETRIKIQEEINSLIEEENILDVDKNLDTDFIKVQDQSYAVVSFIGPIFTAKTDTYGLRVMGVFPTYEDAEDHIDILMSNKETRAFDTCIVELYKFVPSYPFLEFPETLEPQEFVDSYLNEVIINYKKQRIVDKINYNYRKTLLAANKTKYKEKDEIPVEVVPEGPPVEMIKETKEERKLIRGPVHQRLVNKLREQQQKQKEQKEQKTLLNLESAPIKCGALKYVLISYVVNGNDNRAAMKLKGAFVTEEDARAHVKNLIEYDATYDILIAEMYKWIPCIPDTSKIETEYNDERLNILNKAQKKENLKTRQYHRKRIDNILNESTHDTITAEEILKKLEGTSEPVIERVGEETTEGTGERVGTTEASPEDEMSKAMSRIIGIKDDQFTYGTEIVQVPEIEPRSFPGQLGSEESNVLPTEFTYGTEIVQVSEIEPRSFPGQMGSDESNVLPTEFTYGTEIVETAEVTSKEFPGQME